MITKKIIKTPFGDINISRPTPSSGATVSIKRLEEEFKKVSGKNIIPKIEDENTNKGRNTTTQQNSFLY